MIKNRGRKDDKFKHLFLKKAMMIAVVLQIANSKRITFNP